MCSKVISLILLQLVEEMRRGKPNLKMDRRMTGSNAIDEVLHEVGMLGIMK